MFHLFDLYHLKALYLTFPILLEQQFVGYKKVMCCLHLFTKELNKKNNIVALKDTLGNIYIVQQ